MIFVLRVILPRNVHRQQIHVFTVYFTIFYCPTRLFYNTVIIIIITIITVVAGP